MIGSSFIKLDKIEGSGLESWVLIVVRVWEGAKLSVCSLAPVAWGRQLNTKFTSPSCGDSALTPRQRRC